MGNIIRIAWVLDNPLTFLYQPSDASVVTLHYPFAVVCGILMVFFWQTTASKSTKIHPFLSTNFLYGGISLSALIALAELGLLIFYSVVPGGDTNNLVWFVQINSYCVIFSLLSLLYCFVCAKALLQIRGLGMLEKSDKFTKLTIKVILSGVGMIMTALAAGVINIAPLSPAVFVAWLWLSYMGLFVQSFPELLLFGTPRKKDTTKSGSSELSTTVSSVSAINSPASNTAGSPTSATAGSPTSATADSPLVQPSPTVVQ